MYKYLLIEFSNCSFQPKCEGFRFMHRNVLKILFALTALTLQMWFMEIT